MISVHSKTGEQTIIKGCLLLKQQASKQAATEEVIEFQLLKCRLSFLDFRSTV